MAIIKTDQTDCYDAEGQLTDCSKSGQDGEMRAGSSWPSPRFETRSEIVMDRCTGLMWPTNGSLNDFPLTWDEAHDYLREVNRESMFGFSDWQLPARSQLFGLVSHARINPALPSGAPFENVFSGYYWTSSPCSGYENQAWSVHLGGARVVRGMKHRSYMVWPVRSHRGVGAADMAPAAENKGRRAVAQSSAQSKPVHRWESDSEAVHDRHNDLTWLKAAGPFMDSLTWSDAFEQIDALNVDKPLGKGDWRLPNVRELESLVDIEHCCPATSFGKSGFVPEGYWSSTTSVYEPRYAWVVYFGDGAVGVGYKSRPTFHARAVRGGTATRTPSK